MTDWDKMFRDGRYSRVPDTDLVRFLHTTYYRGSFMIEDALDLGCGSGINASYLDRFGFANVEAIDKSEAAISIARQLHRDATYSIVDINYYLGLCIDNRRVFDLIVDIEALYSLGDKEYMDALRGIAGVLATDGFFFSKQFGWRTTAELPGLVRYMTREHIAQNYREAGLEIVSVEELTRTTHNGTKTIHEYVIVAKKESPKPQVSADVRAAPSVYPDEWNRLPCSTSRPEVREPGRKVLSVTIRRPSTRRPVVPVRGQPGPRVVST